MERNKIKDILRKAIHSALVIDDEYGNPFYGVNDQLEEPIKIYRSFKKDGLCLVDVYPYHNLNDYKEQKDHIFINQDLLILDWELSETGEKKYKDTLEIICDVVKESEIRFIAIYTNSPDVTDILYRIVHIFVPTNNDNNLIDRFKNTVNDIIDKKGLYINYEEVEKKIVDVLKGYFFEEKKQRKEIEKIVISLIQDSLETNQAELCKEVQPLYKNVGLSLDDVLKGFDLNRIKEEPIKHVKDINLFPIDRESIRLNNTFLTVIQKSRDGLGVEADKLYEAIVDKIIKLPNHGSFLFSLKLRSLLHNELGKIGRSIGVIEEKALSFHAKKYEDENDLANYLASCVSCLIEDLIHRNVDIHDYKELFEGATSNPDNTDLIHLNKLLTFTAKDEMFRRPHKMGLGDVFLVNTPIAKEYQYLMCISAACDCARPESKICYNYTFVYGKHVEPVGTLNDVEKRYITFLDDSNAIEWSQIFMTINMKADNVFDINKQIDILVGADDIRKMSYIGCYKRLYAQRVATNVFNNAMRVGVDLPNLSNRD